MMGTIQSQLAIDLTQTSSPPSASPNLGSAFAAVLLEMGVGEPTPPASRLPNLATSAPLSTPQAAEELKTLEQQGSNTIGDLGWVMVPSAVPRETVTRLGGEQVKSSGFATANTPFPIYASAIEGSLVQSKGFDSPGEELFAAESDLSPPSIVVVPPAATPILPPHTAPAVQPETTDPKGSAFSISQTVETVLRLQAGKTLGAESKHGMNSTKLPEGGSNLHSPAVPELLSQQQPTEFPAAAVLQFVADYTGSNTLTQVKNHLASVSGGEQIGTKLVDVDTNQLDSLMREISEVAGKTGRAAFRMTSEHLGGLEVRLHTEERGVSVTIRTESEQSHTALTQAQKQLTDDLRANGLRVAETSVALGRDNSEQDRSQRSAKQPSFVQIETAMVDLEQDENPINARASGRFA